MKVTLLTVVALTTVVLCSAADLECKYRKARKLSLHWADPTDCGRYYRCTNKSVKREVICAEGRVYNQQTGKCSTNRKGLCKLTLAAPLDRATNPCADEVSGSYIPQSGYCRNFYICNNNQAYPQVCDSGSVFNATTGNCIPDTGSECWQNQCINEADGSYLPDASSCASFYICVRGEVTVQECSDGSYFNHSVLVCQPDPNGEHCWENLCVGKQDGVFVRDVNNCHSYYVCAAEKPVKQECPDGSYFDLSASACLPGECPPDESSTICPTTLPEWTEDSTETSLPTECNTTPTTECSQHTTPASDAGCSCPGGYKAGELIPFPNYPQDCSKYYECSDGKLVEKECGDGNLFNSSLGVCVPDTDNICWTTTECPETTTAHPDVGCSCPGGYREGELLPFPNYPQNCSKYYECSDGKLIEKECGEGNLFDSSLGVCVPDTDNICWTTTEAPTTTTTDPDAGCSCPGGVKEGELIPFPNYPQNCSKYYECSDGKLIEKECCEGNLFDSSLGVCVPDTDNICWTTTEAPTTTTSDPNAGCSCPGGVKEGELIPFPNYPQNCSKYYECSDGKLIEKECGEGNIFNSSLGICVPDIDHVFWPVDCNDEFVSVRIKRNVGEGRAVEVFATTVVSDCTCPGGYEEGQLLPFPGNCSKYYVCSGGKLQESDCGFGNRFDCSLGVCVPDTENTCWPSVTNCTCPGGYEAGELLPFPGNCSKYYVCSGGKLQESDCGFGNRFDCSLGVCVPDTENTCWPSVTNCTCPGGYEAGELLPFPGNCSKYYVCSGGKLQESDCGFGNRFDCSLGVCVPDTENTCWPSDTNCTCPGGYEAGELLPFPGNCSKYYVCSGGKLQESDCGFGNRFDCSLGVCVPDTENTCWPSATNCTCPGGYEAGELLPFPGNCSKYYVCSGGKLQESDCGFGNRFDCSLGICVPDTDNNCWPNVCKGQLDGTAVADPTDCTSFYLCEDGQGELYNCPEEKWFNPVQQICSPDFNATCINPCKNTTGIKFLPSPDCTKYFFCNDGQPYLETCASGGFDINLGKCADNAVCEATLCLGKDDGTTSAVVGNDTKFYLCLASVSQINECPLGSIYHDPVGVCLEQPSTDCDQSKCNSSQIEYNAFGPLTEMDDTAFCLCRNGAAFLHHCTNNYTFRADLEICYSNAPCDPEFCDSYPENTRSPNRNDTQSFCLCVSRESVIVGCPKNQTYNPVSGLCQTQDSKCSDTLCLSQPDYTILPALNNDTNGFCMCLSSGSAYKACGDGKQFDVEREICLSTTAVTEVCSDALCAGNEGLIYGITGYPNNFCYCGTDGKAIQKTCPNSEIFNDTLLICQAVGCDGQFCLTNPSGPFPALNEPNSFCMCASTDPSSVTKYSCENGTRFDPYYLICLEEPCDSCYCSNSANDGVSYPANNYPQGFCICNSGSPQLHTCPSGTIFDPTTNICTSPINVECDISQCANATLDNTYPVAAKNDSHGFCYCFSSTEVEFFTCPDDALFDPYLEICMVNGSETPGTPSDNCTCPGGYEEGQVLPNPTNCRLYYVCSNGRLQEFDCGVGKYFDKTSNECQVDTCDSCVESTVFTCVGAYREGEFVAHRTSNQLFYLCHNARLTEGDCGPGNYFDKSSISCQPLDNNNRKLAIKRMMRSEKVPDNDTFCVETEKQPVLSNCSQYEICLDGYWIRLSCPNERYYNPEQRRCSEPRDDTICAYGRVKNLPICNTTMEQYTISGNESNCAQYYRCSRGKWRFKTCPKQHFYSRRLKTCIISSYDDACVGRNQSGIDTEIEHNLTVTKCRHMAVRQYEQNCAMYLMCLEDKWWHQYCPLGMYFNHTHNYCLPNTDGQCATATDMNLQLEYSMESCDLENALRPSAASCDRYYECQAGFWESKKCEPHQYFNATERMCLADAEGVCAQFHEANCDEGEMRAFPLKCTAYEKCTRGEWQRMSCSHSWMFDNILHACVPNDGSCADNGLRKVCNVGETRAHPLAENCTQFYYCLRDTWKLATCLKGHTYAKKLAECVPHEVHDQCQPLFRDVPVNIAPSKDLSTESQFGSNRSALCLGREDGSVVPNPDSCLHFFICTAGVATNKQKCIRGSFFDAKLGYCRPNDGNCLVPLSGICAKAIDGGYLPHPEDCQAYYHCSTLNGTELLRCAEGNYYHNATAQCQIDHGECRPNVVELGKCTGVAHGKRLPHERYCNIYYACVRGVAIPAACPPEHHFNANVGHCVFDEMHKCESGTLSEVAKNGSRNFTCGNLTDGVHMPDTTDCTKYYVCSAGVALLKNCPTDAFFDAEQQLCVPDDGACPNVIENQLNQQAAPPHPTVCEGKHGYMMPDPANCNEFYVCINGKLRHERCNSSFYFNASINQCQPYQQVNENTDRIEMDEVRGNGSQMKIIKNVLKCNDKPINYTQICSEIPQGSSIAEQGDCRRYINCNDAGEPVSQRCRNGESYDSLLGFCRQNDGTCLLENGQRVGECNGHHGVLVRDTDNCRGYFVCINGQKIAGECEKSNYFNRVLSKCIKDENNQCGMDKTESTETKTVSCIGLSDSILYPYTPDNCRSYFQCVHGTLNVHECADGLYFNASITRCVKEVTECVMPEKTLKRAPDMANLKDNICEQAIPGQRYANRGDNCHSFYVCAEDGSVSYATCGTEELFSRESSTCEIASNVICEI